MLRKRICAACLCLSLLLGTAPAAYGAEMEPDEVPTEAAEAERTEVSETSAEEAGAEKPEAPEAEAPKPELMETAPAEEAGTGTEETEEPEKLETPAVPGALEAGNDTVYYYVEGGAIIFDPQTGSIIDCEAPVTRAEIPSSINGVAVTSIGSSAFSCVRNMKSVSIPNTVTNIGKYAFNDCLALESIEIPGSVTVIGDYA